MKDMTAKLLVIGAGPGGYVCAIRAGQLGIDTVIVEAKKPGGTCLNEGCIPSKALIHAAEEFEKAVARASGKSALGIAAGPPRLDFSQTIRWKDGIVGRLNTGVSALLKKAGVKTVEGWARFLDGKTVEVETEIGLQIIRAEQVVIATGSTAATLPNLPFGGRVISSTEALALKSLPGKLVVVGAGYIGLELGTAFAKLGSAVHIVEAQSRILPQYDAELTQPVAKRLAELGITVLTGARVKRLSAKGDELQAATANGETVNACRGQNPGRRRPQAGDGGLGPRSHRSRHGRPLHPHRRPVPDIDARRLCHRRCDGRAHAGAPCLRARRDGGGDRRGQKAQLGQGLHPGDLLHRPRNRRRGAKSRRGQGFRNRDQDRNLPVPGQRPRHDA